MQSATKASFKSEIKVGRFLIPYRIYGKSPRTLVCINGIQQSMAIWGSFAHRFSRRYTVILFDFPPLGKARVLSGSSHLSLDEQVEILHAVIKAAGTHTDLTVCSASWGGVVASIFAVRHPKEINRLVMAGMGAKPNQKMVKIITEGIKLPTESRKKIAETLIENFGQELSEEMQNKIVSQFERMDKGALEAFYQHGLFILSSAQLSHVVDLRRIRCETTLLVGEKDRLIDREDVDHLASQIPGAKVRVIKGSGHFFHLENAGLLDIYEEIFK